MFVLQAVGTRIICVAGGWVVGNPVGLRPAPVCQLLMLELLWPLLLALLVLVLPLAWEQVLVGVGYKEAPKFQFFRHIPS